MKFNPIFKKELRLGARSIKIPLAIMFYNFLLAIITVITIAMCTLISYYGQGYSYEAMMSIFPIIAWVECIIMMLLIPVIAAGSIAGEREKQTLDIMLTTPIKSWSIIMGKLYTAITSVLMFVISSIPIMSIAFVLGGLSWWSLLGYVFMMIYIAFYVGSIGIFCSSLFKKTILAIVLTLVIELTIIIGTGAIAGVGISVMSSLYYSGTINSVDIYAIALFPLLFNPLSTFFDFTLRVMSVGSIKEYMIDSGCSSIVGWFMGFWIPASLIINIVIALGLDFIAAIRINPHKKVK